MQPATIKSDYKTWRRAMLAALRNERRNGNTPRRNSPTTTRAYRAFELRARRGQLLAAGKLASDSGERSAAGNSN